MDAATSTALVYAIIEAPGRGWTDGLTLATLAAAILLLAGFAGRCSC